MRNYKSLLISNLASTFEWYDYALFGYFAPLLAEKFFPSHDQNSSLLEAFLVFALGYLMRPVGGIIFGFISDKFGRKTSLTIVMFCMAFPSGVMSFLPTYNSIGAAATWLMVILRMMQGLAMGGALTGTITFSIEHAPAKKRGFIGSLSMASICLGILLGSLIASLVRQFLTEAAFEQWGWRIPFFLGIIVFFVGVYFKRTAFETPDFDEIKKEKNIVKFPLIYALKKHYKEMLIGVAVNALGSVIFYFQAIYLMNYLRINRAFNEEELSLLMSVSYLLMSFTTVISGIISDYIGRFKTFLFLLILSLSSFPFLLKIFETGNFFQVICAQIIVSILASAYIGPEPALQVDLYPSKIRSTALSLSYNLATSLFGGMTPYIIEIIMQNTGSIFYCFYYILVITLLSFIGIFFYYRKQKTIKT